MSFIDEIYSLIGGENNFLPAFKATIFGGEFVYFESVKKILSFSSTSILFATNKKIIEILGENLRIKKYCFGDMIICGKISSMSIK